MNKQLLEHFTDFGFNVFGIIDGFEFQNFYNRIFAITRNNTKRNIQFVKRSSGH